MLLRSIPRQLNLKGCVLPYSEAERYYGPIWGKESFVLLVADSLDINNQNYEYYDKLRYINSKWGGSNFVLIQATSDERKKLKESGYQMIGL